MHAGWTVRRRRLSTSYGTTYAVTMTHLLMITYRVAVLKDVGITGWLNTRASVISATRTNRPHPNHRSHVVCIQVGHIIVKN